VCNVFINGVCGCASNVNQNPTASNVDLNLKSYCNQAISCAPAVDPGPADCVTDCKITNFKVQTSASCILNKCKLLYNVAHDPCASGVHRAGHSVSSDNLYICNHNSTCNPFIQSNAHNLYTCECVKDISFQGHLDDFVDFHINHHSEHRVSDKVVDQFDDCINAMSLDFNVYDIYFECFNKIFSFNFVSRCDLCINLVFTFHFWFCFPGSNITSTVGPGGPPLSHTIGDFLAVSSKFSGLSNSHLSHLIRLCPIQVAVMQGTNIYYSMPSFPI
jgi:hypothetical protein